MHNQPTLTKAAKNLTTTAAVETSPTYLIVPVCITYLSQKPYTFLSQVTLSSNQNQPKWKTAIPSPLLVPDHHLIPHLCGLLTFIARECLIQLTQLKYRKKLYPRGWTRRGKLCGDYQQMEVVWWVDTIGLISLLLLMYLKEYSMHVNGYLCNRWQIITL